MKKLESSFKNMVIVLTSVAVLSGSLLGFMNEATREPIEQAKAKNLSSAIATIVPGFTDASVVTADTLDVDGTQYVINKVTNGEEFVGAAVESSSANGFSGVITILVGFDANGNITDYSVLSHAETPGLGSKMDVWFKTDKNKQSIVGMNPGNTPLSVTKDGGNVDAITASTITSRAFLAAVNSAYTAYMKKNPAGGANDDVASTTN